MFSMPVTVDGLVPFAHVADVERSIRFYELLGFRIVDTLKDKSGKILWADIQSGKGALMLARADEPVIPEQQAVLFYLYTADLAGLREHLLANNVQAPPVYYPPHMPKGEMRIEDPDGYCLLIGQNG